MASVECTQILARIVSDSQESLHQAGQELRDGGLVAFPTETVYGLGADALQEDAVRSVFVAKGRPLTDPLIVHVSDPEAALPVLDFDGRPEVKALFQHLAATFWPGPLTLVSLASAAVPPVVTASTGFVGVRCPDHRVAAALLRAARVPVCAPSANRFGHVSPTSAAHVLADLGASRVTIVDGGAATCAVGIESTVAKLVPRAAGGGGGGDVVVLRRGAVTAEALAGALLAGGFDGWAVRVSRARGAEDEAEAQEAPGQLLRHYSPDLEAFNIASHSSHITHLHIIPPSFFVSHTPRTPRCCSVVIDFNGRLSALSARCAAYRDLSPAGSADEAAKNIFEALRWAEAYVGAERVLMASLPAPSEGSLAAAVNDRMRRAASGKLVALAQQLNGLS
ncbi:DHBP synthase RibB-like alpha/beta domain-containing protein [Tribonema minus]|uniref:Threonylcarbamoyl-AMP synthase n=1 Tax=Tribonema minus TaxID=303371 RepID=A0A835YWE4_9STRA|nr:DHBP synthase RibB-like alpha/beta domain-containing protein [Tribonema minus]